MLRIALHACLLAVLVAPFARPAFAEIGQDKHFGIGLEASHGPGVSFKYEPTPMHALQFGISAFDYGIYRRYSYSHGGYYYNYDYSYAGFLVHAEYLVNPSMVYRNSAISLPWYGGFGADLGLASGDAAFAVHGNLGMALQLNRFPFDFFLEWTPRLWIADFFQFHPVDFNAGVRFWF
jgi:hypothetical protein